MLKVNASLLMSALCEAKAYSLPEMNAGTSYLFEAVYTQVANGGVMRFSELDYDRFDMDDIRSLRSVYCGGIEKNNNQAGHVISAIEKSRPVSVAVTFA